MFVVVIANIKKKSCMQHTRSVVNFNRLMEKKLMCILQSKQITRYFRILSQYFEVPYNNNTMHAIYQKVTVTLAQHRQITALVKCWIKLIIYDPAAAISKNVYHHNSTTQLLSYFFLSLSSFVFFLFFFPVFVLVVFFLILSDVCIIDYVKFIHLINKLN